MATPITAIDSPNILTIDNQYNVSITGSVVGQTDLDYLLSAKYSFTGSFIRSVANGGEVGFGYGILQAPSVSPTSSLIYPATTKTDFSFFLNGVRLEDYEIDSFSPNGSTQSTASLSLGYELRSYDVVTAVGKFKV